MDNFHRLKDFEAIKISVASPERILQWTNGEVTKPETINYRTFRPEKDGLFDERIFGPTKDFECYCGKYRRARYKGTICDKCGVEVTRKSVRRERMGHIKLAAPIAHAWYFRGIPSKLGLLLDISPRLLESVVYYSRYIVISVDYAERAKVIAALERELKERIEGLTTSLKLAEEEEQKTLAEASEGKKAKGLALEDLQLSSRKRVAALHEKYMQECADIEAQLNGIISTVERVDPRVILSEDDYFLMGDYLDRFAKLGMGAEALRKLLDVMNLDELSVELHRQLPDSSGQKRIKLIKRLGVVESLRQGGVQPSWMVLTMLPVIPPDLRPMVQLEGGRFATSDLNDLYRAVINRNNRLKRLLDLGAPEIIVRNEKRMLQEAVDALIDSSRSQRYRLRRTRAPLKSLTDIIKGKQGRFRQNLLGKRVDYSGRSVIVGGPRLKLYETGLPKEMALELFKPFVIRELLFGGFAPNPKSARYVLESRSREVWDALEKVVDKYPILLNRAPTLHRLGILAFYPRLIEGNAIQLHPCVCSGFNADFDGDQMAVHVPLSEMAKAEASQLMLASQNLIKPADGEPLAIPVREMALGTYYLTSIDEQLSPCAHPFADEDDAIQAHNNDVIGLRQPISVYIDGTLLETTVGRIYFNRIVPPSLRFINAVVEKKMIRRLVDLCIRQEAHDEVVKFIDAIKDIGFIYSTKSGVSVSIFDCVESPQRDDVLTQADERALGVNTNYTMGLITAREKSTLLKGVWEDTLHQLDVLTWEQLRADNSVKIIISAGASRASQEQVKQLGGMKGIVVKLTGEYADLPIKSNFRRGLSGIEYFTATRAGRKTLADTALKTADSGYLTRRLVDVAQEILVSSEDCGAKDGFSVRRHQRLALVSLGDRVSGRYLAQDILASDGGVLAKKGTLVTHDIAKKIDADDSIAEVIVRSPLTCACLYGICQKCYGLDLASRELVAMGTPVGVVAAQSIGEPGTQLTLRTFHAGGIVGKDITQGLPRITELFEARTPRFKAITAEVSGTVSIREEGNERSVIITQDTQKHEEVVYAIPKALDLVVQDGDAVRIGDPLTDGCLDPKTITKHRGMRDAQRYILEEVQHEYWSQGAAVNDKHVEVVVRQMFTKVFIEDAGDSTYFPGDVVGFAEWFTNAQELKKAGKRPARAQHIILGITRSALKTESFLAAASFQETSRVLTDAALSGKVDRLRGLKENVIIGRRIPVGDLITLPIELSEAEGSTHAND